MASYHICGASIIHERLVLTAAHCVDTEPYLQIRIGSANNEYGGLTIEISRIVVHENWDPNKMDFDYALLKLRKPFNFTDKVKPIALPSSNDTLPDGTLCEVSGWGKINNNGEEDEYLRKISLPILNQVDCVNAYNNFSYRLTSQMICADYRQGSGGVCSGDSGGPLTCKLKNCEIRKFVGIVSWGLEECANFPGVFSRVSAAREWIEHITGV